jgi:bacteriocin-like protein
MDRKKALLPQAIQLDKRLTVKNLPVDLVELSEKDLQRIIGGRKPMDARDGGIGLGKGCGSRCTCRIDN